MQSQINFRINPNNQLILQIGEWRKPLSPVSQSCQSLNDDVSLSRNFDEKLAKRKAAMQKNRERNEYLHEYSAQADFTPPLDIILKTQQQITPPKYLGNKPKSFTAASGQKLRECGAAVDIASCNRPEFSREITLTLPANNPQAFKALADYSSYVVNRLFQPIRVHFPDCLWFFVWEYQKRGALHMHICTYHENPAINTEIAEKLIQKWHEILMSISEMSGVCMFTSKRGDRCTIRENHQHHTSVIEKSVGGYFSKYAGKKESKNNWYCTKYPVSRFWGCAMKLKAIIKEHTRKIALDMINEPLCQAKFAEIVEKIIEKLTIVSSASYDFAIELKGQSRISNSKYFGKYLVQEKNNLIAQGTRYTFYCSPECFGEALRLFDEYLSGF